MTIIANQYKDNSKYLNATNTDGACAGRDKPRYIGGAGVYSSVAYDWGGFDTVGGYNGYMDPNTYQAGDINTAASESCSRGVDCAGFVSRVWGLSSYHNCRVNYPHVSSGFIQPPIYAKRVMNNPNKHVVWFDTTAANGIYDYESTTDSSYDRVVRIFSSWSRLAGYTPRRYCNV